MKKQNIRNKSYIKKKSITIGLLLAAMIIISGCAQIPYSSETRSDRIRLSVRSDADLATQELSVFSSIEELEQFLAERRLASSSGYGSANDMMLKAGMEVAMDGAVRSTAAAAPDSMPQSASDYSQTNVQIAEVDEADFIKNDDRYIYIIADNRLLIIDAYDAANAKILSETQFSDASQIKESAVDEKPVAEIRSNSRYNYDYYYLAPSAKELFIYGDMLVIFVESNERAYHFEKYDIEPRTSYRQYTTAYIYDISDRESPKVAESFRQSGRYYQSRMIDGIIYMVTQEGTHRDMYYINQPIVRSSATAVMPDIYYFDNPDDNYQFNTITSIDVSSRDILDSKTFMLGYANTLMVSVDSIFIAYQKQSMWRPWFYQGSEHEKERFFDIILPELEGKLREDIRNIVSQRLPEQEEWDAISKVLSEFFMKLDSDDKFYSQNEAMLSNVYDALMEYDMKKALDERKTVIHKISIEDGALEYIAKGEVDGYLLNQFSMDEHEGNLRIATTVSIWLKERVQYNNVYVLDEMMQTIGKIENIAEDEQIFSARFIGDRLYMVTFETVDPFFVIDLSNPRAPKILGELKLPGFSNYLHPYDENHIIGIGRDTKETSWGFTTEGIKIALFDVSDVSAPRLVDSYVIGGQGSDSAALHDHKAFLFSESKGIMVLPITEVTERDARYVRNIWHGAYVFDVSEQGFELKGRVRHDSSRTDYWSWWDRSTVSRSLYMDDNLYTVSTRYIKINDLGNELEELGEVRLPFSNQNVRYY